VTDLGVAVLGAGRIGSAVVSTLTAAGYAVHVYDPREDTRRAVEDVGAQWRATAYDALDGSQVVMTLLPGTRELEQFVSGTCDELLAAAGPTRTWIDLTSASPIVGRRLAAAAEQAGVAFLCAPLGGGPSSARSGSLALYVGGDSAVVAEHRKLLTAIADPAAVHHVGGPEAGYAAKLLVNLIWFAQAALHGEALLLGQAVGLAPFQLHELLALGPAASAFNTDYVPRALAGDYVSDFSVARIAEELQALTALATERNTPFPVSAAVTALYERAALRFDGADGELLAIAELEAQAGRRLGANGAEADA
jgi:3-hydroxyisobutyrate dehydrogenase